ncbi:MAG TPA: CoA transferase [Dehalococcoidia bacterium]|nr:CoA transferase [Dehalococcoidia bacterium]
MGRLPLEGIRVIDLTVVWAGPFGGALLGDLGAEVIKVDSTQRWDVITRGQNATAEAIRKNGGDVAEDAQPWNLSANFNSVGRNKKSVTIDLTRKEGQEVFYRLAANSDVFIENNAPDVIKRFNITYDDLKKHNPELIMASLPAFGATGPYSFFRAYGANMEAVVGHTLLRGYTDADATTVTSVFLADACGGATSAFAITAALHHRRKTGRGQFIDMSQAENVMHTLSQAVMDYSMNGRVQTTMGNRHQYRAPQGCYPCTGEDHWITISVGSDAEFAALCGVIGREELISDPRFADSLDRYANQDALDEAIAAWSATRDHIDAFYALQNAGIAAGPVLRAAEIFNDPQLQGRDDFQKVTHPAAGTYVHYKSPIHHMSETPLPIRKHAALLGEDNEYVYKQVCGYSDDEYRWFVENGHAGTTIAVPQRGPGR